MDRARCGVVARQIAVKAIRANLAHRLNACDRRHIASRRVTSHREGPCGASDTQTVTDQMGLIMSVFDMCVMPVQTMLDGTRIRAYDAPARRCNRRWCNDVATCSVCERFDCE